MPMTDFSFQINASTDPAQITCSQENLHFYQTKLDTRRILSVCTRQPIESIALRLIP